MTWPTRCALPLPPRSAPKLLRSGRWSMSRLPFFTAAIAVLLGLLLTLPPPDQVAAAPPEVEVYSDWPLIPAGLGVGDKFRLMYVTKGKRNAEPILIGPYNHFVFIQSLRGDDDLKLYAKHFRAVGSTGRVDARENTGMWANGAYTDGSTTTSSGGIPIYSVNGAKVVNNYADFYDGSWAGEGSLADQDGNPIGSGTLVPTWTGSKDDGTKSDRGASWAAR